MIKITKQLLAGGAALLLITTPIIAQNDALSYNHKPKDIQSTASRIENPESDFIAARPKLADNFAKHFPGATNASWSKLNAGSQVCFLYAGKKSRAVFTEKDELSYSICEYSASELPTTVSKLIKNDYSDYTVFSAQEVKANQMSCYHIVLENTAGYVKVKIAGDELEEVSRTNKAK